MDKKYVLEVFDGLEKDLKNSVENLSIAVGQHNEQYIQGRYINEKKLFDILHLAHKLIELS